MLSAAAPGPPTFGQNDGMFLDEAYRILEVQPTASDEEIKAAHRDLTKVWHPDRFVNDASMRRKSEEKLKQINEALVVVQSARGGRRTRWSPPRAASRAANGARALLLWIFFLAFTGFFILMRRPTVGGLIVAAALFATVFILLMRMKRRGR
jgi:hypothetical protein